MARPWAGMRLSSGRVDRSDFLWKVAYHSSSRLSARLDASADSGITVDSRCRSRRTRAGKRDTPKAAMYASKSRAKNFVVEASMKD